MWSVGVVLYIMLSGRHPFERPARAAARPPTTAPLQGMSNILHANYSFDSEGSGMASPAARAGARARCSSRSRETPHGGPAAGPLVGARRGRARATAARHGRAAARLQDGEHGHPRLAADGGAAPSGGRARAARARHVRDPPTSGGAAAAEAGRYRPGSSGGGSGARSDDRGRRDAQAVGGFQRRARGVEALRPRRQGPHRGGGPLRVCNGVRLPGERARRREHALGDGADRALGVLLLLASSSSPPTCPPSDSRDLVRQVRQDDGVELPAHLPPGEAVFKQGDAVDGFYIVRSRASAPCRRRARPGQTPRRRSRRSGRATFSARRGCSRGAARATRRCCARRPSRCS